MLRRDPRPRIRTQAELDQLWRGWVRRRNEPPVGTTCLLVYADGRVTRSTVTFTDLDGPLDDGRQRRFVHWIRHLLDDDTAGWRIAFMIARPGAPVVGERDLAWATSLYVAARLAGVACEVVHLAAGNQVRPLPLDALPSHAFGH
ncbi:hypothetical protein [Nocardioides humi]|nr:hypothetical protein [Nocardioides humi]